ncbi:MAG TPA: type II secretion system F family protein [Candidatus Woesearchaeota archaeon]|nr:type II secretion system F family protein [Candidatus Woesearchaeota archaeon]
MEKKQKKPGKEKSILDKYRSVKNKDKKLKDLLIYSGYSIDSEKIKSQIFWASIIAGFLEAVICLVYLFALGISYLAIFLASVLMFPLFCLITYYAIYLVIILFLDVTSFMRAKEIEKVLPDFFQLASNNIKAGMSIDRALYLAVKPNFTVLAKEIETVGKKTMAGYELQEALNEFASRYNSKLLARSISLIVESLDSGGEIAELLSKVSNDIYESNIIRKELSSSVTTYVIFISFATVVAAPLLFALSTQVITIMNEVIGNVAADSPAVSGSILQISSGSTVSIADFKSFVYLNLIITSTFSASIIAMIKKGTIKEGLKQIPMFIIITLLFYYLLSFAFNHLFAGMLG